MTADGTRRAEGSPGDQAMPRADPGRDRTTTTLTVIGHLPGSKRTAHGTARGRGFQEVTCGIVLGSPAMRMRAESVVARSIASWPSPLEHALFGTDAASDIVRLVDDFCRSVLGDRVATVAFYRRGVGGVFGLRLASDRSAVVKVHRPEMVADGLDGIRRVQRHLADAGLPAPRPIGDPAPLGRGVGAAEELLDRGRVVSARTSARRRVLVEGLLRFVRAAQPLLGSVEVPAAYPFDAPSDRLWPPPHDLRFDLTLAGGEWIDELGAEARSVLSAPSGRTVIGHADWRVQNLRVQDGRIVAIYDWDSVARFPEPALVGATAATFTATWGDRRFDPYPSLDDVRAFVTDYERARGDPFSDDERRTMDAAGIYRLAYSARCEHSDAHQGRLPESPPSRGWRHLLRIHAGVP
jgi:hypothetical protein